MENNRRKYEHKKNASLERIFPELEKILGTSEKTVLERFKAPEKKVFLIVGCARSGSTLLYQYLADTNYFFYPTNFLSRFYYSPYIGYRIQQALIDFDFNGEIFPNEQANIPFVSSLGKTKGPKQPHEFWYFWNRFFKFGDTQKLSEDEINNVDWETFLKELHALEIASEKPLLMKAMNLNWNLTDLKKKIPNIHFIFIKRNLLYNAQSLLMARKKFFGNCDEWYSYRPPNYESLKNTPIEEQVIEQVIASDSAIEKQLKEMRTSEYSIVDYSDFCKSPSVILDDFNKKGILIESDKNELSFENQDIQKIENNLFKSLNDYIHFKGYKK